MYDALKRTFDVVAALIGLIVLGPVFIVIAMLVKLSSHGPALYQGVRTGRNGRPFKMLKFRTMIVGADKAGGTSTGQEDPRVTSIGWVLRRYKLDELPQLINVLWGEMSIVGPRPEVEEYTRLYDEREQIILSVRPGLTDYASIHFINLAETLGSKDVDRVYAEEIRPIKNQLRVKYVQERSFWVDLKIILKTLRRILARRS